jgi:DNA-binding SARP family transcriptional activator
MPEARNRSYDRPTLPSAPYTALTWELEHVNDRHTTVERSVRIELLSGRAVVDGVEITLTELQQTLVCALARCRHPVPAEQLEAMIWPDAAPDPAHNQLCVGLHRLRKRLGDRSIIASPTGFRLGDHIVIDLWEVEALSVTAKTHICDRASALRWLAAQRDRACRCNGVSARFEFIRPLERRMHAATRTVTERFANAMLRCGEPELALELAQLALVADACDEAAHEIAIRCRLALGDRAAAICEYRQYSRALADELGLEPSFSLRSLIESSARFASVC